MQIKTYGSLFAQLFVAVILVGSAMPALAQNLKGCRDLVFEYDDSSRTFKWAVGCFDGGTSQPYKKNKLKVRQQRNVNFYFKAVNPFHFSINDKSTATSFAIPNSDGSNFLKQLSDLQNKTKQQDSVNMDSNAGTNTDNVKKAAKDLAAKSSQKPISTGSNALVNSLVEPAQLQRNSTTLPNAIEIIGDQYAKKAKQWEMINSQYQTAIDEYVRIANKLIAIEKVSTDLQRLKYSEFSVANIKQQAELIVAQYAGKDTKNLVAADITDRVREFVSSLSNLEKKIKDSDQQIRDAEIELQLLLSTWKLILLNEKDQVTKPLIDQLDLEGANITQRQSQRKTTHNLFLEASSKIDGQDWEKKSELVNLSLLGIRQLADQIVITKVAEGDKLDVQMRVSRKYWLDNKVVVMDTSQVFNFCIRVKQGIKVSGSTGVGISSLFDQPYNYFNKDSAVAKEATTRTTPLLTTMVHAQWRAAVDIAFGLSLGLGVPLVGDKNIHYLFGPSLFLGSTQRLIITAGLSATTTKTLGGSLAVGDKIPVGFTVPTQQNGAFGAFFSLSYNLNVNSTKP